MGCCDYFEKECDNNSRCYECLNHNKPFYCIAYKDKNGNGFSAFEPWIIELGDNVDECKAEVESLFKEGNQEITIFMCKESDKEKIESVTWEYVNEHKVLVN